MQPENRIHADPLLCDQFDRLPDSLVLVIFDKLADVRSLGRCSAVSKRFNALVPLVHDVYVKIDRVVTIDGEAGDSLNPSSRKSRNLFTHLMKLMLFAILKPFHQLRNVNGMNKPLLPQVSQHSPAQVLKKFTNVRNLRIELPAGDVGTEDGVLLKWRAEFGSTLQSCLILWGTKVDQKPNSFPQEPTAVDEDNGSIPDSFYTNGGLKLRVIWTISSLIAASTRHYLLRRIIEDHPTIKNLVLTDADGQGTLIMGVKQLREFRENPVATSAASNRTQVPAFRRIIEDHPTIKNLVLTDADGQGTLIMGVKQLREFRENPVATSAASNRTQVPASNMKLRYAPFLKLPEGMVMQGATLVAIRPSEETGYISNSLSKKETETFVSGAFDESLKAAIKALVKRRTYLLEMNGF